MIVGKDIEFCLQGWMVFCGKEKERRSGRESGRRMGGRDDCL
jgi:hypothetical protein